MHTFGQPIRRMTWPEYRIRWQELDRRVLAGEFTPDQAVEAARTCGLIAACPPLHLPHEIRDVMVFVPKLHWSPSGPWLMVRFNNVSAPLIYSPFVPSDRP